VRCGRGCEGTAEDEAGCVASFAGLDGHCQEFIAVGRKQEDGAGPRPRAGRTREVIQIAINI
jgi:hypothetical protein